MQAGTFAQMACKEYLTVFRCRAAENYDYFLLQNSD